jgi:bifunctional non-homologous end joining protein LigD
VTKRTLKQIQKQSGRVWTKRGEIHRVDNKKLAKIQGAAKKSMPEFIRPELATLVTKPPEEERWLHEIKWDGYRIIARIEKKKITLLTRNNNNWTDHFPEITRALKSLKLSNIIMDGEVVAINHENKADFQLLQNHLETSRKPVSLIYFVFDLLYYQGYSLLNVPLIERKRILKEILDHQEKTIIQYNDHILGQGSQIYQHACEIGLEGIISKQIHSAYIPKRTKQWLKLKCSRRQEFVIGGYSDPKSSRQHFGAILLGYYDEDHQLKYCGKVGTGFTDISLKELASTFKKYRQKECPFVAYPEKSTRHIHWLTPKLVGEVEYLETTKDGILRHPSFKGLRSDKDPDSITLELPKNVKVTMKDKPKQSVRFTNLNKVLYPELEITKADLANYYELAADWILPHIKNRPLTVVRCPEGIAKKCFYQRHSNDTVPSSVKAVAIPGESSPEYFIYINNLEGLLGLVQMSVLEIHPWGSTIKHLSKPDRIIFDLDPAPDVPWKEVVATARLLHEFIDYLNLKNFVKTTGGKGLHIVVPILPTLEWDEVRAISKCIADLVVAINPDKYIATMSKAKRTGKIFIDYLRNARAATGIAPYSTRAKPTASIATPLSWDELTPRIKSDSYTLVNINKRLRALKTDPWEDFFKVRQGITQKIKKKLNFK